ncbi:hypothetical protein L1987_78135 [Smallanthus sonchifolius]|uniref:Uncharacterized protein n=1 Tax=Smallanthus sonchifolius TaxID=185202 RepID=A0ACB8ZBK1_9ASTR|nr:hypothetical protein L1987_78135 [Smallanthus sonchifolius]
MVMEEDAPTEIDCDAWKLRIFCIWRLLDYEFPICFLSSTSPNGYHRNLDHFVRAKSDTQDYHGARSYPCWFFHECINW